MTYVVVRGTISMCKIKMNTLHFDAILHICRYLSDADNIKFSTASRFFNRIKFGVTFDTEMYILEIITLPYFNRFSNVVVNNIEP